MRLLDQKYYVGLDPGKLSDPTGIVMVHYVRQRDDYGEKTEALNVNLIERCAIGMSYQDVVARVKRLFLDLSVKHHGTVILDCSGVGEPVRELLLKEELPTIGIVIQGGHTVTDKRDGRWSVPRIDLLTTTRIAFDAGLIHISDKLALAEELLSEIEHLKDRQSPVGKEGETLWREREHDDIAFALMCPVWYHVQKSPMLSSVYDEAEPWKEDEGHIRDYDPLGRK